MPNKQQIELLNKWEGHSRWLWNHFLDLEQKEYAANNMSLKIRDWICPQCGAEHDRDVNAALNILWWGLMATPNTAGTAGIDACGVSKPLVDEGHMTGFGRDTLKQEACGSLVHR